MKGFSELRLDYHELEFYFPRKKILLHLKENIGDFDGTMLDVGCGKKPYRVYILSNSKIEKYIGIDIKEAIDYGGEKPEIYWEDGKIPLEDNSIDSAIATEVLEHVPNVTDVLTEVFRVLKPGGVFIFTVPFIWPLHETPHDHYRYTPYALNRLMELAGFKGVKIKAMGGWNAALGQMMALWIKRNFQSRIAKRILYYLFYPIIWTLFKTDKVPDSFKESTMFTGLGITARK